MNTLEKKLKEIGQESVNENDSIIEDVKLLLSDNASKERETLRSIGLDNDIKFAESKKQDNIIRSNGVKELGRDILHHNEIRRLCLNYRLYLRPANKYVGSIPPDLGAELTRFCLERNIIMPAHSDHSLFMIIAPPKMFEGYRNPGQVIGEAFEETTKEIEERRRLRDEDPILVYRLPSDPGYYAVIKSWGSDFTPLRRVYGWITTHLKLMNFTINLSLLSLVAFIMTQITKSMWHGKNSSGNPNDGWFIVAIIFDIAVLVVSISWVFSDDSGRFRRRIMHKVQEKEVQKIR